MAFMKISALLLVVNLYFTKAVDFSEISHNLYVSGSSPPPFPTPSPPAVRCFNIIWNELNQCKSDAIKTWNITETSSIRDLCCAEWELIECDISAAKAKCSSKYFNEVMKYADDLINYYNSTTCLKYPKAGAHCILPTISKLSENPPPALPPLANDCLNGKIARDVRFVCYITAKKKWNVTRRAPVRNHCCAAWDQIDCLDAIAKVNCPSVELTTTENFFSEVEDWAAKGPCSQATYHSANCSNSASVVELKSEFIPYIPSSFPSEKNDPNVVNSTHLYLTLSHVMNAFSHLTHLMILLAIILVTIIVIQCFIIARQLKQDRLLNDISPRIQGYQKMDT